MFDLLSDILREIFIAIGIFFVGLCGGFACGFIILSFGFYIGKSGYTGMEHVGYWNPSDVLWLTSWTGVPLGGISFVIAYYALLRGMNWNKMLCITFFGTVICGCVGACSNVYAAVFGGIIGFWGACFVLLDLEGKLTNKT